MEWKFWRVCLPTPKRLIRGQEVMYKETYFWEVGLKSTLATTNWCNRFTLGFYKEKTSGIDKLRNSFVYLSVMLF